MCLFGKLKYLKLQTLNEASDWIARTDFRCSAHAPVILLTLHQDLKQWTNWIVKMITTARTNDNLDLLYLLVQASDVCVRFLWSLFQFHDSDHRVGIIRENTDNSMDLASRSHHSNWSGESIFCIFVPTKIPLQDILESLTRHEMSSTAHLCSDGSSTHFSTETLNCDLLIPKFNALTSVP